MFVLCIAYVCASFCASTNLLWHVKIATPTVQSVEYLDKVFVGQLRDCFLDH